MGFPAWYAQVTRWGRRDTRRGCEAARTPCYPEYADQPVHPDAKKVSERLMMLSHIRVAILDDHQSIIDGFIYRLSMTPRIKVVATSVFGENLEPMIADNNVDVLLLDVSVPNSPEDHNTFPVLHIIPRLMKQYPKLNILVISMFTQRSLIDALVNTGISGYIFKDDQASIQKLDKIVESIAKGGIYFSQEACRNTSEEAADTLLTPRQLEALSLCVSHPDSETIALAGKMGITGSTMRNLLSGAYVRLGVRTRAAAIARAQQLGILPITPEPIKAAGERPPKQSASLKKRSTKKTNKAVTG
jgi:two-component system response regulator NreC